MKRSATSGEIVLLPPPLRSGSFSSLGFAAVLQLGDDGDQVLQTEEIAAVQALVHHTVSLEMSAGRVGKVYHPYVHHGIGGGRVHLAVPRVAAAAVTGGGQAVWETKPAFSLTRLFHLLHVRLGLCLLAFVVAVVDVRAVLGVLVRVFQGGRAVVDYEQRAGVEAVRLACLQGGLHVSELAQHRGEELASEVPSTVEELE